MTVRRTRLGRPGPIRVSVIRIAAVSLAVAALIFGVLWLQMRSGGDPVLGPKAAAASAKVRRDTINRILARAVRPTTVPQNSVVSAPAPVVTQAS